MGLAARDGCGRRALGACPVGAAVCHRKGFLGLSAIWIGRARDRGKGASAEVARREEGLRLLAALPKGAQLVALDERGTAWSTAQLARELAGWLGEGRDLALLIGGPEGLDEACRARADRLWSLSPLTFPHPLVRVILAEQLYRAWSLLGGHPYHRA